MAIDIYKTETLRECLDDFRAWDDVFAPGSNWASIMSQSSYDDIQRARERLNDRLVSDFLDENIPPHDRSCDLATLRPSEKSQMPLEFQARIIAAMREQDSTYGWAFFGLTGWSKSSLCSAWFARYVREKLIDPHRLRYNNELLSSMDTPKGHAPRSMWRISALTLIEESLAWQYRDFSDKRAKQPRVSSAWIEELCRWKFEPCLYLEEVDKVRTDKAKLDIVFDVLNAMYNFQGVLLMTSNLTPQEFSDAFGPEFARRIAEMCNVVNCFTGEIKLKATSMEDSIVVSDEVNKHGIPVCVLPLGMNAAWIESLRLPSTPFQQDCERKAAHAWVNILHTTQQCSVCGRFRADPEILEWTAADDLEAERIEFLDNYDPYDPYWSATEKSTPPSANRALLSSSEFAQATGAISRRR